MINVEKEFDARGKKAENGVTVCCFTGTPNTPSSRFQLNLKAVKPRNRIVLEQLKSGLEFAATPGLFSLKLFVHFIRKVAIPRSLLQRKVLD